MADLSRSAYCLACQQVAQLVRAFASSKFIVSKLCHAETAPLTSVHAQTCYIIGSPPQVSAPHTITHQHFTISHYICSS